MSQLTSIGEACDKVTRLNQDNSQQVRRNAKTYTKKNIQMYFNCHKYYINSPLCSFKKLFRIFKLCIFQNMI